MGSLLSWFAPLAPAQAECKRFQYCFKAHEASAEFKNELQPKSNQFVPRGQHPGAFDHFEMSWQGLSSLVLFDRGPIGPVQPGSRDVGGRHLGAGRYL